jgi:formylglycine-generating enzyme required for sulfatase activity
LLKIYPANASVAILDKQGSSVIEFEMTADARKIDLPQGDYRIVVRNKGYESLDVDLHLESGKLLERDLLMTESPPSTIAHVDKSQDTRPAMESAGEVTSDKVASADSMLSKETNSPADMNAPILALNENAPKPDAVGGVKWDGWPMGKGVPKPMVVPCSPKEVREYQRQWARYYKKKEFITFNKFMNFAFIPPGEFEFGMDDKDIQELVKLSGGVVDAKDFEVSKPKHRVVIREPFYISVNEVNQAQVFALFGRTSYRSDALAPPDATKSILPAASNYAFAIEFCNKLCELNKLPPAYLVSGESIQSYGNKGFRLPTEEEWEFVARAGSEQRFWCKLEELHKYDIFRENSATLFTSVLPNPFGLFHVHGNFGEYVEGRAGDKFAYQPSKTGLTLMERSKENVTHAVIRGSTSSLSYLYYHVGRRTDGGAVPSSPWLGDDKGFRVIMDIDVVK